MKSIPAMIAGVVIAVVLVAGMLAIGSDALANTNTVPMANSPSDSTAIASQQAASSGTVDQQVSQLQALVQQYQDREKQYQDQLSQAAQRITTDEQQLANAEQILQALEQRGIIRIDANGQVTLRRGN